MTTSRALTRLLGTTEIRCKLPDKALNQQYKQNVIYSNATNKKCLFINL